MNVLGTVSKWNAPKQNNLIFKGKNTWNPVEKKKTFWFLRIFRVRIVIFWQEAEFMNVQFREVSGHNLESSQTWGFRIQSLHYKTVSNHFFGLGGGGGKSVVEVTVNSNPARRKTLKTFVPIRSKNSTSGRLRLNTHIWIYCKKIASELFTPNNVAL